VLKGCCWRVVFSGLLMAWVFWLLFKMILIWFVECFVMGLFWWLAVDVLDVMGLLSSFGSSCPIGPNSVGSSYLIESNSVGSFYLARSSSL
jgi:hypothetical protein